MQKRGRFLDGSTMGHVVRMTMTSAVGITFVFLVDLANLFWLSQFGNPKMVAAMGFAFAIQFFSVSSGIGLMIATTALVSRRIGKGEQARAREDATASMVISVTFQAIVAAVVVALRYPLLELVGASGETLEYAARYLLITIPSLAVMAFGLVGSAVLRAEGDGKRAMFVTLTSGTISMAVDPFMILYLGWGIDGAAWALVLSRVVLAGMALRFAVGTHDLLARPAVFAVKRVAKPFFAVALPAMLTQLAAPFGNYLLTGVIAGFGDNAVAGWAVLNRLTVVAFGGIFSLSGAIGGIFGQNYGAGQFDRLRSTFRDALVFAMGYAFVTWVILAATAEAVVGGFGLAERGQDVYLAFAYVGAGGFMLVGALFVATATFNNLGKPGRSTLINWARDGVFILPAAMLGAGWFAAPGVVYGQTVVSVVVGIIAALWAWHFLRGFGIESGSATLDPAPERP
ncbi:putative MATE family efflux protein [Shimia isoporae]|uniref:Putative MATE family efflux protein n=1 Tax=Shimia isoporae TaxID=647720 RepID=A0A4R1NK39_9RHOB|nr:MATE family efflux transporter [Shimia isoporae]TCL08676.1 putative MATE family efflux protein [Shimia isoporae]